MRTLIKLGVGVGLSAALVRWQLARLFVEQPRYELESRRDGFEIRRYPPAIVAETAVSAPSWKEALNIGFRRLARYIFANRRPEEPIAMTSPVTERSASWRQAPSYVVTFTMPRRRSLASLPEPKDERIELHEQPARRVAVLRFSGRRNAALVSKKTRALREALAREGLEPTGPAVYAGYDPPWTLPWLRRNEVWLELPAGG